MNPAVKVELINNLKWLNLSSIRSQLETLIRQAQESRLDYGEFLLGLTEVEVSGRMENGRKRRIREARFPLLKVLEMFQFEAAPGLDARLIHELMNGEYMKQGRNVIFMGKSGTGKTHLAISLAMEACRQGVKTRFVTGCGLVNELLEARNDKTLSRVIKRYSGYGLLVIDELGYVTFAKEHAELLFQVLAGRHEQKSVIITSNKGFGDWTEIFGDATLTAALLDRVTHKAYVINCTWESFRLQETLKLQKMK